VFDPLHAVLGPTRLMVTVATSSATVTARPVPVPFLGRLVQSVLPNSPQVEDYVDQKFHGSVRPAF
jgi:hypothetical protein